MDGAPKNWKIIPDEGRLDEDGKPMAARKLDSRAKLEQAGDAAAKGKSNCKIKIQYKNVF